MRALAELLPSFAGYHFDDNGDLVVLLTESPNLEVAAELESWLQDLLNQSYRGGIPSQRKLVIKEVDYSFSELSEWRNQMLGDLFALDGVVSVGLWHQANAIEIGVGDASLVADALLYEIAASHGVPEAALAIAVTGPMLLTNHNLFGHEFPEVPGGARARRIGGGSFTVGFPLWISGPDWGWMINSHSTEVLFQTTTSTDYRQPLPSSQVLGQERMDPASFPAYICNFYFNLITKCRRSDAAFISTKFGGAAWQFARIARTESYQGSIYIDHDKPTFTINGTHNLIEGQFADKVGMSTGWTYGRVIRVCLDMVIDGKGLFCQSRAERQSTIVDDGDSGAPVFLWSGDTVKVGGILHSRNQAKTWFNFSPFENIELDFGQSIFVH